MKKSWLDDNFTCFPFSGVAEERVKRQAAEGEDTVNEDAVDAFTKELCASKGAQEYFRLSTQDCRKVIQCTEVVSILLFQAFTVAA